MWAYQPRIQNLPNSTAHAPPGLCQHKQVGTSAQNKRMGTIFCQTSVSDLPVMEQPLDDEENILHFAANPRLLVFDIPIPVKPGRLCFPVKPVTRIGTIVDAGQMLVFFDFWAFGQP